MGICRGNAEWAGSSPIGTWRQKWRWQCRCSMVNSYICDSLWYFTPFALHKLLFPCKLSILSWTCLLWYPPLLHSPLVPASAYTVEGHFFWWDLPKVGMWRLGEGGIQGHCGGTQLGAWPENQRGFLGNYGLWWPQLATFTHWLFTRLDAFN